MKKYKSLDVLEDEQLNYLLGLEQKLPEGFFQEKDILKLLQPIKNKYLKELGVRLTFLEKEVDQLKKRFIIPNR